MLRPSLFGITLLSPRSYTATQEFVVPKSIPITFPILFSLLQFYFFILLSSLQGTRSLQIHLTKAQPFSRLFTLLYSPLLVLKLSLLSYIPFGILVKFHLNFSLHSLLALLLRENLDQTHHLHR